MSPAKAWSLRARLLLIVLGAALLAWVLGAWIMVKIEDASNEELSDAKLADMGNVILRFAGHELREIQAEAGPDVTTNVHLDTTATLHPRYMYQIWSGKRLLLRSTSAPADRRIAPVGQLGFGHAMFAGEEYCTYVTITADRSMELQIAEPEAGRALATPMGRFSTLGAAALLLTMAVLAALSWAALSMATSSMKQARDQLEGRGPLDLMPLQIDRAPRELLPMIGALNQLIARFRHALQAEQDFTGFAAHELRTPLASLRTMAQVVLGAREDHVREEALHGVVAGVDRCAHLVTQLLAMTKIDARLKEDLPESIDVPELLVGVVEDLLPRSREEQKILSLEGADQEARITGGRFAIQMMMRNLIDNAVRYTPSGGVIIVSIAHRPESVDVLVDDSGPGIPENQRAAVFERFRRLDRAAQGVGLGLSIVRSVAAAHRCEVTLEDSPLGGLRARAAFPNAPTVGGQLAWRTSQVGR